MRLAIAVLLVAACGRSGPEATPLEIAPADQDLIDRLDLSPLLLLGDVDGDHELTAADVTATRAAAADPALALACPQAADWDWSGAIEPLDATVSENVLASVPSDAVLGLPLAPHQYLDCATPRPVASRDRARPGTTVPLLLLAGHDYVEVSALANATVRRDAQIDRLYWIDISATAIGWAEVMLYRPLAATNTGSGSGAGSGELDVRPDVLAIHLDPDEPELVARTAAVAPPIGDAPATAVLRDAGAPTGDGGGSGDGGMPDGGTPPPPPPPPACNAAGNGCALLYLDYHHAGEQQYFPRNNRVIQQYRDRGCDVFTWHALDHKIRQVPTERKVEVTKIMHRGRVLMEVWRDPRTGRKLTPEQRAALQAEIAADNRLRMEAYEREMRAAAEARDRAIADYRDRVRASAEDVYEIVSAHGSGSDHALDTSGTGCGLWGSGIRWAKRGADYRDITMRAPFVQGNYAAANHTVCSRTMVDASCHAGLGVIANAYANNTGSVTCPANPQITDSHPLHAGDRLDAAFAACGRGLCYSDETSALVARAGAQQWTAVSTYRDGGYNHCTGIDFTVADPRDHRQR